MGDKPLRFWVKGAPTSFFKSRSQAKRYSLTYHDGPTTIRKGFAGLFSVYKK